MKKIWIPLLMFPLFMVIIGCSQTQSTTTTTFPPVSSFLGVGLEDTTGEVVAALGTPEKTVVDVATSSPAYIYSSLRNYSFDASTNTIISILTSYNYDSLRGVARWMSASDVVAAIGNYESKTDGSTYYAWKYPNQNIIVYLDYVNNVVHHFGIYDSSKISDPPEYQY